jgi:pimeloyl-ACP methyl ester carboxylesterase
MRIGFEHGMFLREIGSRDGAPVVWIHGLGESGLCFEGILAHPRLQGRRHLVPDLPGYGRSPAGNPPRDFAGVTDHLAAWLGARGEPAADLVGHSLGGVLALILAERHPARVRRVVDVEGNKSPADCVYSGRALAWSPQDFAREGFDLLRAALRRAAVGDPAVLGYLRSLAMTDPGTFWRHAAELVQVSGTETLAARLVALKVPAHYIAGSPGGASERSLALLETAGCATTRVAPSGHWPFIDQPGGFAEVLGTILDAGHAPEPV